MVLDLIHVYQYHISPNGSTHNPNFEVCVQNFQTL